MTRIKPDTLRPLPEFFQGKGWASWEELCHHVWWANTNPTNLDAWRDFDGTKEGFFKTVGFRQGAPLYVPGGTVLPYGG